MKHGIQLGQDIILNGTPRSGKSSIATAIQEASDKLRMNLGTDRYTRYAETVSARRRAPAGRDRENGRKTVCAKGED